MRPCDFETNYLEFSSDGDATYTEGGGHRFYKVERKTYDADNDSDDSYVLSHSHNTSFHHCESEDLAPYNIVGPLAGIEFELYANGQILSGTGQTGEVRIRAYLVRIE